MAHVHLVKAMPIASDAATGIKTLASPSYTETVPPTTPTYTVPTSADLFMSPTQPYVETSQRKPDTSDTVQNLDPDEDDDSVVLTSAIATSDAYPSPTTDAMLSTSEDRAASHAAITAKGPRLEQPIVREAAHALGDK